MPLTLMDFDASALLDQVKCYQCYASNQYSLQLMELAVLKQILLAVNPNAVTDAKTLLNQATCYQCYSANEYSLRLIETSLLVQVLNASVGGGTNGGTGSPVGVVTPSSSYALYIQTDSVPPGQIWEWYGGAWH